jgi:hypothetical protein
MSVWRGENFEVLSMSSPESRGVTSRAVAIGIILMFANCYWIIGMEVVLGLGWVTIFSLFMNFAEPAFAEA